MATGTSYPNSIDSWSNKNTGDQLTATDVNQRTSALEAIELAVNSGTLQSLIPIQKITATTSAVVTFTTGINSTYDAYLVKIIDAVPATNNDALWLRISQGSIRSSGTDYRHTRYVITDSGGTGVNTWSTADAKIIMANNLGNGTGANFNGNLHFFNPAGTTKYKPFTWDAAMYHQAPNNARWSGSGVFVTSVGAIDGIQFLMSTGNISGTFTLYGIKSS